MELTAEQAAGAASTAGLTVVTACAGAGKTTALVARVAHLLARGVPPPRLAVLSFSVRAAGELKRRLEAAGHGEGLVCATVHGLAWRLLRRARAVRLLEEAEAGRLLAALAGGEPSWAWHPVLRRRPDDGGWLAATHRLFRIWRERGLDETSPLSSSVSLPVGLLALWRRFLEEKRQLGAVEFCDFAVEAWRAVPAHGAVFDHIVVDEAQDLSAGQTAFLRRLLGGSGDATLAGDEDQAMYGFRGATGRCLSEAERWFPEAASRGVGRFLLGRSQRCPQAVLDAAEAVLRGCRGREPRRVRGRDLGVPPEVLVAGREEDEVAAVRGRIVALTATGAEPGRIAVLARTASVLGRFEAALMAAGVPVSLERGVPLLERAEGRDVAAWLELAWEPASVSAFLRVHDRPSCGVGRRTAERVAAEVEAEGVAVYEAAEREARRLGGERGAALGVLARRLRAVAELGACGEPVRLLSEVVRASEYGRWREAAGEEEARRWRQVWSGLVVLAEGCGSAEEFREALLCADDTGVGVRFGRVTATTIHAAKGLEWDHVFLVGAAAGVLPSALALREAAVAERRWGAGVRRGDPWVPPSGGLDEERRLFAVALTRARLTATITASAISGGGGGERRRRKGCFAAGGVSPFVAEAGLVAEPCPAGRPKRRRDRGLGKTFHVEQQFAGLGRFRAMRERMRNGSRKTA